MCRSVTAWLFIERILLQQLLHSFGIAFSSYPSLSFIRSSLHIYGTKWSSVTFQINTNACSQNLSDFLKWNMMVFVLTAAAAASSILCILLPRDDWWYAGEEHLILQPPAYCECVQFVLISKSNMNMFGFSNTTTRNPDTWRSVERIEGWWCFAQEAFSQTTRLPSVALLIRFCSGVGWVF